MAKTNVTASTPALPTKIEKRLADLQQMGEFDQGEVEWCRRDYWSARSDWHTILVACFEQAQRRHAVAA